MHIIISSVRQPKHISSLLRPPHVPRVLRMDRSMDQEGEEPIDRQIDWMNGRMLSNNSPTAASVLFFRIYLFRHQQPAPATDVDYPSVNPLLSCLGHYHGNGICFSSAVHRVIHFPITPLLENPETAAVITHIASMLRRAAVCLISPNTKVIQVYIVWGRKQFHDAQHPRMPWHNQCDATGRHRQRQPGRQTDNPTLNTNATKCYQHGHHIASHGIPIAFLWSYTLPGERCWPYVERHTTTMTGWRTNGRRSYDDDDEQMKCWLLLWRAFIWMYIACGLMFNIPLLVNISLLGARGGSRCRDGENPFYEKSFECPV